MNMTERQRYPNRSEPLRRRALRYSGSAVVAGVLAIAGLAPVGAQERPMLVEYLPVAAQSADEVLGTEAHAIDEILSDSGVLALRIGHAAPEPVIHARALSIVLPGTDETLTFDDLVVEALDSGYALYSRDRQSTTSTTLVVMGEDVVGTIHHDGAVYGVRPLGDGLTAVYLYDAAQLREPPEIVPDFVIPDAESEGPALPSQRAPPAVQDSRGEIDVLVAYSESAKRVAGNIAARIALLVVHTHLAYESSGITTRLRVVHSYETSYTPLTERDFNSRQRDLSRLRTPDDGVLDEALEKREQFGADVVMLLFRQSTGFCGGGVAYKLDHTAGDAEWAFGLSGIGAETCSDQDGSTFAHEIGHIQGAGHNLEELRGIPQRPYPYGHGFCNATNNWRTVMSYNTGGRCEPRTGHFSNPLVLYRGTATGDVGFRNVARLINETATHVANFRQSKTQPTTTYMIPFLPPASDPVNLGFVRLINRSNRAAIVNILAFDDTGERFGPVRFSLGARQARHFNSLALENGSERRWPHGVGNGTGNWRLEISANVELEPLAYSRSPDGFLTSMNALAVETQQGATWHYRVPFFQGQSIDGHRSRLRLINPGDLTASVTIASLDDSGVPGDSSIRLTIPARAAAMLTTEQLGGGDRRFSGRLGDGVGRWRLSVSSNARIRVMSLTRSRSGHLTNVSRGLTGTSVPPRQPTNEPDLIVESPAANPSTPRAGQFFLLNATVRNQGGTQAAASRLRFYRSSDATISRTDVSLQVASLSSLPPSGTINSSISVRAPSTAGTYYYGACVDSVSEESDTGNNCSSAVRVTVSGGGYWGALANGWSGPACSSSLYVYGRKNGRDRAAVNSAVLSDCRSAGRFGCTVQVLFQQCGTVALGGFSDNCNLYGGSGPTSSAAEQNALSRCGARYGNCRIPISSNSGAKVTFCNTGAAQTESGGALFGRLDTEFVSGHSESKSRTRLAP